MPPNDLHISTGASLRTPVRELALAARAAGFAGVALDGDVEHAGYDTPAHLRDLLAWTHDENIPIAGMQAPTGRQLGEWADLYGKARERQHARDLTHRTLDAAYELGCRLLILQIAVRPLPEGASVYTIEAAAEGVNAIVHQAVQAGVTVALENTIYPGIQPRYVDLFESVRAARVCAAFETGHALLASRPAPAERPTRAEASQARDQLFERWGEMPEGPALAALDLFTALEDRLAVIELSDNDAIRDAHNTPGAGLFSWRAFLRDAGVTGHAAPWIVTTQAPGGPMDVAGWLNHVYGATRRLIESVVSSQ